MKTFIKEIDKTLLRGYYDNAVDIIKKVSDLCADAIDEIVNLFAYKAEDIGNHNVT